MKKSKIGLLAIVVFSGLVLSACTNKNTTDTSTDNGQQNQTKTRPSGISDNKGPGQQIDLATAAETLGVTEENLRSALGMNNVVETTQGAEVTPGVRPSGEPKKIDLTAAAETLGVTEDALKEALGMNNIPLGQAPEDGQKPEDSASSENN